MAGSEISPIATPVAPTMPVVAASSAQAPDEIVALIAAEVKEIMEDEDFTLLPASEVTAIRSELEALYTNPQIAANDSLMEYDHPTGGRLRQARPAPRFSATPTEVRHGAPALGEHTREVLAEAGIDAATIATIAGDQP